MMVSGLSDVTNQAFLSTSLHTGTYPLTTPFRHFPMLTATRSIEIDAIHKKFFTYGLHTRISIFGVNETLNLLR